MKRFYKTVEVAKGGRGWRVLLDGRAIKTPMGRAQIVPTQALAEVMAAEWAGQGEEISTAQFVLRDMADYAIDIAGEDRPEAVRALMPFAESDTLCYRAEPDEALHGRQLDVWEPLLLAAERRWDVHFTRISGVLHQPQPPETLGRLRAVLEAQDQFSLAALRTTVSLAASLVIGLTAIQPEADAEALWSAANLEEDWQAELWGWDHEAEARRARRLAEFSAAVRFAALARA